MTTTTGPLITALSLVGPLKTTGILSAPAVVVRCEFTGSFITTGGADADAQDDPALGQFLHRTFLLEFGLDGTFHGARGEAGAPSFVDRLWSALGEYLQLVQSGQVDTWEVRENDASGRYIADYRRGLAGGITKRKVRYVSVTTKILKSYEVVSSEARFKLDDQGQLNSVLPAEETRAVMGSSPLPDFEGSSQVSIETMAPAKAIAVTPPMVANAGHAMALTQSPRLETARAMRTSRHLSALPTR
ncbi:MAG: hypothetical protein M3O36_17135 [Myxococcota bacterium]|nr:hypothetical protein [Myxococcota bacterium]